MGKTVVPSGDLPLHERVIPEKVWYRLLYCPHFPLDMLNGKLDKDYAGEQRWILGLLADIRNEGRFKNPVIVWNHHPTRGVKQPTWLLRAGSNRVWCAEQLGWETVPAIVSVDPLDYPGPLLNAHDIKAEQLQDMFPDGGHVWANDFGFGLLRAKKPEETYAEYEASQQELQGISPTRHGRTNIEKAYFQK